MNCITVFALGAVCGVGVAVGLIVAGFWWCTPEWAEGDPLMGDYPSWIP